MWSVSDRYLETINRPHTRVSKVEILHDGAVVATLPSAEQNIDVVGGQIQVDRADIRRSGTVDFIDLSGTLLPDEATDLFVPFIGEIRPYTGVIYHDATGAEIAAGTATEYVPLATLVIANVKGAFPRLSVSGFDRMYYLTNFTSPYTVASGTNVQTALSTLLYAKLPSGRALLSLPSTEHVTGLTVFDEQSSVLDAVHTLGTAAGWQVYADPMGTIIATDEPSTDDPSVMTYGPGELGKLMRPERTVSGESIVNAWKVTGDSADLPIPVSGYAQDDNPNSITYVGRIGVRPKFQSGPYTTSWQCGIIARALLTRNLGLSESVVVPVVPNHAFESGDVIQVIDPDQSLNAKMIVDSFNLGIRASDGDQRLTCRTQVIR